MADKNHPIDIEKTGKFAEEVFGHLGGALISAMIHCSPSAQVGQSGAIEEGRV
jgi:hypothetical protein